jgi:hypothetical protein
LPLTHDLMSILSVTLHCLTTTLQHYCQSDDDEEDDLITERARMRGDSIEGEEDEDESRDKFTEMGEVIEPFNLKNEREAGGFDENMNYVFQKEKGEVDAW